MTVSWLDASGPLPTNAWSLLAATNGYAGKSHLLVDGVEVASGEAARHVAYDSASAFAVEIGSYLRGKPERSFDGLIDEVVIFERALSIEEIRAIHFAGAAGYCRIAR